MIFETEDETRDFITINRKDYVPRKVGRPPEYRPKRNCPAPMNILNWPYKYFLNTRQRNAVLPPQEQSEDPQQYLNEVRDTYPVLGNSLPKTVPNEDLIDQEEKKTTKTIYQLDYSEGSSLLRTKFDKKEDKDILPEGWIISETIHKQSYRNPREMVTQDLLTTKRASVPSNHLDPNPKERDILRVCTGNTEYGYTIAATGNRIITDHLFGIPLSTDLPIVVKDNAANSK